MSSDNLLPGVREKTREGLGLYHIRNLWSPKHKQIHAYTRAGMNQIQIAAELNITQSAVSQAIDKARIAEIKEAENNLKQLLNDLFRFQSSTHNS